MRSESPPVREAVILICKKCGSRLGGDGNPSKSLQKALKSEIKETGRKRDLKALLVDCMDICPKDRIATALISISEPPRFVSLSEDDLKNSTTRLLDKLLRE